MKNLTLYIGTKRGLFIARSDETRSSWSFDAPQLAGREVYHIVRDPRDGAVWVSTRHAVWGAHLHRSDDDGRTWHVLESAPHFPDGRGLHAIWCITPGPRGQPGRLYAGIEPAGLFASDDGGESWYGFDALNEHPSRETWQPAGNALALHSVIVDPDSERRIWCAVSAGGAFRTEDGGASWLPINDGVRADYLLNPHPATGQCVHRMILHPARPSRLYQQNHCGVYRSDDGGTRWTEITGDLPSEFGYVLATDPGDPDSLYVVPEESSHMRTTCDGRLRVFRTRDSGHSWQALTSGLPQENAWVSLLREAMCNDTLEPAGIYMATSTGHVFASRDAGDTWHALAAFFPRVISLHAVVDDP
jgi:photosystem II stability/assembly factor-like uncharacterized protein